MSSFHYAEPQRALQDRFDTRRLADTLNEVIVHDRLSETDVGFITSRDMFWLATVGSDGMPTVSYKGGAPGFVTALDDATLAFPSYDGNGMFYSMGNVDATASVGMLFMDFEKPHRLRVQGQARLDDDPALKARFPGAQLVVRVQVMSIFQNCPRYVHRMQRVADSRYVPAVDGSAPVAGWKRIDFIQPSLAGYDQGKAEAAGGLLTIEQWGAKVVSGDPEA